jgi:hypothetical protein
MLTLQNVEGELLLKDQIREYMDHGDALEQWCYLNFFLGTYDGKPSKDTQTGPGRPPNERVPYRSASNHRGHCRVVRSRGHETMPYFPGRWFPEYDDEAEDGLFHASMLALLKPWRLLCDLKSDGQHFRDAFNTFVTMAPTETSSIIENIQFFYESARSAKEDRNAPAHDVESDTHVQDDDDNNMTYLDVDNDGVCDDLDRLLSEDDVDNAIDWPFSS